MQIHYTSRLMYHIVYAGKVIASGIPEGKTARLIAELLADDYLAINATIH